MNNFKEYKSFNYAKIAEEILSYWQHHDIFHKSVKNREGSTSFTFYEGPPSANGTPGIHHVMARTVKDIFCRYKTLKGFQVKRKGGWDTHGLPVELQVEKELGITKENIGKTISIEEYNNKCREAVMKYKDQWDDLTEKMGFWLDLDDPYITFERDYVESVWFLLKKFYEKGLLYKGYTIQPYSPAAGTGLSTHELNMPGSYRDIKDTSIAAQFKLTGTEKDFVLAWTTTPWTLPANNALCVNKYINYVKVSTFNAYTFEPINVILAKDRMEFYFSDKAKDLKLDDYNPGDKLIPFEVIEEFKGEALLGRDYEQLMPYVELPKPAFSIFHADFVSVEDGTGVVHISRTFGSDDFKASVQNKIPGIFVKDEDGNDVPIVDKQGRFVKEITDFAGMYVKNYEGKDESDPNYRSTDTLIAIKLKEENKAFRVERYVHSYPHCWRTDKPVLYYPMDSWFIKTTAYKEQLVALNNTINWKPKSTGIGRFGNWLENLEDWNLSRSRFWGTPLPIWMTEDQKESKCIGSIEDLKAEIEKSISAGFMDKQIDDDFDLHRPFVDDIVLVSEKGYKMVREPDLIDVWFDSGSMPYAQLHYPFENEDIFKNSYPADFIAEGVDQTRGWFFTLHAIAGMLFDTVSFKNVIANGLVLDKDGNKMSKRLGNAVDPFETLGKYGIDPTRWYLISNANPWDNLKFDIDGVVEVQRRFFGTLQNTYSFFALYANLDGYSGEIVDESTFTESDRWITSRLNTLIKRVDDSFEDYEPTRAARLISNFVIDDLSNWYVRLNRKRFWKDDLNDSKKAAYYTLYNCLTTIAKLGAPIAPFYLDRLYLDLKHPGNDSIDQGDSVHLSDFPKPVESSIDLELEERMQLAQTISSLVHSLRKKHKIKVRQPLTKILVPVMDSSQKGRIEKVSDLIRTEINTKEIEFVDDTSTILVKRIKPNFRKLGKLYGPRMKEISTAINQFSAEDISRIENDNEYLLNLNGNPITLTREDVEITFDDIPGWTVASDKNVTVALDITITDELREEGLARDVVNRVQNLRKDQGLDVQDKIQIDIRNTNDLLISAIEGYKEYICQETQALELQILPELEDTLELEIDEFKLNMRIQVSEVH
jgi:isoleucyl-tRNA synthetase